MTATHQRTMGLHRLLPTAVVTFAALAGIALLAGRISLVNAVFLDLNGAEENVVYGIIKVMKGMPLYTDPGSPPFDVIQYTPLYYWLAAGIGHLFGVDALEPQQVYALGRALGLVLNIGFVVTCFFLARYLRAPVWSAALWSVALFALLPRQMYARPDALYLLFFALAMLCFLRYAQYAGTPFGRRSLLLCSVLCCFAVLAKQTGVLPIGIVGAWLLVQRRWKDLAQHAVTCSVIGGLAIGVLCAAYGATTLYENVVIGVRNGFSARLVRTIYLGGAHWALILVQAAGLVLALRLWRCTVPERRALGLAVLITFAFGLLTSLKHGSSHTYYMENVLLASALIAALAAGLPARGAVPVHWAVIGLGAFCIPMGKLAWGTGVLLGKAPAPDERAAYTQAERMADGFRNDPTLREGFVLITAHDHLENFLVGRSMLTQKDVILLYSVRRHLDLSAFQRMLHNGRIRFVVSRSPVEELPFVGRAFPELRPLGERNGYLVFENTAAPSR